MDLYLLKQTLLHLEAVDVLTVHMWMDYKALISLLHNHKGDMVQ